MDIWDTYFKFCVERNPWDKTLSDYHMFKDRRGGDVTLEQYLQEGRFCFNLPKYTNLSGALIVDRVLKYENLMFELGQVFDQLDIPFSGSLGVKAKSEHRISKLPYREVLTQEQKYIINSAFAKEIAMHEYQY